MRNLLIISLSLLLFSCFKDDEGGYIAPVTHSFHVTYNENFDNLPAAGAEITLVNNDDGMAYKDTTDAEGIVDIGLFPGTYQVTATKTFTPEEYFVFSGQEVERNVIFSAFFENLPIPATSGTTELTLKTNLNELKIIKSLPGQGKLLHL